MSVNVYMELQYDNNTYYISNSAQTKDKVYYPYLSSVPTLSIGGEGYAKVTTGKISMIRSDDSTHPFSGDRYYSLLSKAQEIPFLLYYEDEEVPLFKGNLTLDAVTDTDLEFMLVEENFEKKLVYPVLDRDSSISVDFFYLFKPNGSTEYRVMLVFGQLDFHDQDEMIIERLYEYLDQRNIQDPFLMLHYDKDRDNRYLVADRNLYRCLLVDPEDNSRYITLTDLISPAIKNDGTLYYPDEATLLSEMNVVQINSSHAVNFVPDPVSGHTFNAIGYNEIMYFDDPANHTGVQGDVFLVQTIPENEYRIGSPTANPFSFGRVVMRDPVIPFGDRLIKKNYENYSNAPVTTSPVSGTLSTGGHGVKNSTLYGPRAGQEYIAPRTQQGHWTTQISTTHKYVKQQSHSVWGTNLFNTAYYPDSGGNHKSVWSGTIPYNTSVNQDIYPTDTHRKNYTAGQGIDWYFTNPLDVDADVESYFSSLRKIPLQADDPNFYFDPTQSYIMNGVSSSNRIIDQEILNGNVSLWIYNSSPQTTISTAVPSGVTTYGRLRCIFSNALYWSYNFYFGQIAFVKATSSNVYVITQTAHPGQEYIADTAAHTYDQMRKEVYAAYTSSSRIQDPGFGKGWSTGRIISKYKASQIIVDSTINELTESPDKVDLALDANSEYISGSSNIPQILWEINVQKASSITSNIFRLYRDDNIAQNQALDLIVVPPAYPELTYGPNSQSYLWNPNWNPAHLQIDVSWKTFHFQHDSQLSVKMNVMCFAGRLVKVQFLSSGGVISDTGSTLQKSYTDLPIPAGTTYINFEIRTALDHLDYEGHHNWPSDDTYKHTSRHDTEMLSGVEAVIFQRILPEMNSTAGDETWAVYCTLLMNELHTNTLYGSCAYLDFNGTQSSGDAFDPLTDERRVYSIRNPNLKIVNPSTTTSEDGLRVFDDGVELGVDAEQILFETSDENFINLSVDPFGQIAITGESSHGKTLSEFFSTVVSAELNEEDPLINTTPDLTLAPHAATMQVPIYQDSEITVIEMAALVAEATNHLFFFRYHLNADNAIERELVLIDINEVFSEESLNLDALGKKIYIPENEIITFNVDYPYPIKAFESTLDLNKSYKATLNMNRESIMKALSFKYRIEGSGIGKVESFDVFAQTFTEGKYWLKRLSETKQLPMVSLQYNTVDRSNSLGSKISFTDVLRNVRAEVVVLELGYDFDNETTQIQGLGQFNEITYG